MERQDALGRVERPLFLRQTLGGAVVDQRVKRVLDNGFREGAGRVVRAAGAAVGACGNEDTAGGDHHGELEGITAQQASEGTHPRHQGRIVVAGSAQSVEGVGRQADRQGVRKGIGGAASRLAQKGDQIQILTQRR